jgi:uncharacterized protein (TIGR03086 family)
MDSNNSTYLRVARHFTDVLSSVKDTQWQNDTPCDDWDVHGLVEHVVASHQRVYALANADGIEDLDPDALLTAQWICALRAYESALDDSELSGRAVTTRRGEQPFSALIEGLLMIDTLCHSWDLARAIGADESLDPEAVATALAELSAMGDAIRVPGGFKEPIASPPSADEQTKFLNFAGRSV